MALNLNQLDGSNGFRIDGIDEGDGSGFSVAGAGDVNGDGIDDLIVGAPNAGQPSAGEGYVIFGTETGFAETLELASLDGSNGFRIEGVDVYDASGRSVSGAGDVNGDGIDDLIVGAPDAGQPSAGEGYVIFGTETGFAETLELASLDGSNGFRVGGGINAGDDIGISVAGAGDVNDDGIDDLIVGAWGADPNGRYGGGESYVVFGTDIGFEASLDISTLDGNNGFRLEGIEGYSGYSVAGAGDVNGDGIDDVIVGAVGADPDGRYNAGESYVVFGTVTGFAASSDLSTLDGSNGFRIDGIGAEDGSGYSVAGAGDVNGDGIDDLIVGAPLADPDGKSRAGESYIVFGNDAGFSASLDLSALDGSNGFRINGIDADDFSGSSVAGAGDVNGDGFDDLILAARGADPDGDSYAGETYVILGTQTGFSASLDLADLDSSSGFRLDGIDAGDNSGDSVAGAGDVNGDGIEDLIVGAPTALGRAGESYVIFGSTQLGGANVAPRAAADVIAVGTLDQVDLAADNSSGSDHDPNFDDLSIVCIDGTAVIPGGSVTLASGLRVTLVGGTEVRFDAPGVAIGTALSDDFVYKISDGRDGSDTASATVSFTQNAVGLGSLDGSNGFHIHGINVGDGSGFSVAGAGDINGDGFDDLIIGAPNADPKGQQYAGESYILFGTGAGFGTILDPSALDGSNGFRLHGIDVGDGSGLSVAGGGDVNGDGFGDVIVGAAGADPDDRSDAGESYVVFGAGAGFTASLDLSALDGSNGFRLEGIDASDNSGGAVASAGDVNGDGIDDLIVGAEFAEPYGQYDNGESYVVFGNAAGFAASLHLSALDGSNGFRIVGINQFDQSGHSVAGAGDVNGDGIDDLIVGAPGVAQGGQPGFGESYVVFGTDTGFAASLDLSALDGSNGFRLEGSDVLDESGFSVDGAGDVNGDSIDDLIVGAYHADPDGEQYAGTTYVVFGTDVGFAASVNLSALDGLNGFRLDGVDAYDGSGHSVAGAGDVNGDGIDDLIVGAPATDPAGESYVVFGSKIGFGANLDLSALDGSNGFRLEGIDAGDGSGFATAGAGDVNGDGFDDLIIGAPGADANGKSYAGESYIVFGFSTGEPLTPIFGGPGADVLTGSDKSESIHPGGGHDLVITGGGDDTIFFNDRAGKRDVLTITDFDPRADTLDLRGATVAATIECETRTVLLLEGPDCDTIVLLGLSESPFDLI